MMNRYLIDTSAWICALRKDGDPRVQTRVADLLKKERVATCAMIKLELLGGTRSEQEYSRLKARLNALEDHSNESSSWETAFAMAFKLRRSGLTIPSTDILIAAFALMSQAILVHVDRHFDLIASRMDLRVESFVGAAT
ncbi:MAG: PIN domain nuclease [Desulfohalobiaceae bacterium]|nr:PIN domain nuclease [Desulfohalobiaceae bacterium]